MLQLTNTTPFQAKILALPNVDGIDSVIAVAKATFTLGPEPALAAEQLPIATEDRFLGEPAWSSLEAVAEAGLPKPSTDVLMLGTAYAPAGKAVEKSLVSLSVGALKKTVIVFGDRVWEEGLGGAKPTPPKPFQSMPLVWERAYGGIDRVESTPPVLHAEPRNPAGRGFKVKEGVRPVQGLKLPNLEHPKDAIVSWKDRPAPASFGPICPHWEPRRGYAGTYDAAWESERAPYLPKDFDPRFFQTAPPDLVAPAYLAGGEAVEILGAAPSGPIRFNLPRLAMRAAFRFDDAEESRTMNLDTVLFEPDASRFTLVWRADLVCDKKTLSVREVTISSEGSS